MSIVGIIGGSGLENPQLIENAREVTVDTPYGPPSAPLLRGRIGGREVALLARHGREHTIPPSQVNNRANLLALQEQGCTHLLASAACGSLRQDIGPGELVIPDQLIDFTRFRAVTFHDHFPPGIENARHTALADPFAAEIRKQLLMAGRHLELPLHDGGTMLTIEGPRFSTRAESRMFQLWGADLVNMTIAPEAVLAAELGLPYAVVAMVTDYDSWKEDEPPLQVPELVAVFRGNLEKLSRLLITVLPRLANPI
ncbi:S-methyl-5'-thioadenosine phosphorylase [Desulfurivibrio alkaliphilus]|uniref:S-methyl-5'-thioadenosine phosphorylase n=1 Tax=Desulfurivibrio alkaliphilus (strain DSM 19089 / UNIQEM U267 / AHT2) TaxID=589865 RepID=D6Z676_DESAT|nr:S-methyl-5'-thioadenosine phosphorylase [Desulfurivibrio alkaliphilus]ADH86841.1 methylthioadenosine phosphorylase [Desulfurivibrio alkaliphilus AHT 2]